MKDRNYFSLMIVGEEPDKIIEKYNTELKVTPYIYAHYLDAEKLKNNELKVLNGLLESNKLGGLSSAQIELMIHNTEKLTPFQYYQKITKGMTYDENGDAWTDINPNGKWTYSSIGRRFSMPLITLDGKETHQCKKGEVDWSQVHLKSTGVYESIWEMLVENRQPIDEYEATLYDNMKTCGNYFNNFSSKEEYATYNTSFFHYAYADKDKWVDMDDYNGSSFEWVTNFYSAYVSNLKDDDLISIYECRIEQKK